MNEHHGALTEVGNAFGDGPLTMTMTGDVLVAETNAPPRSSGYKGIKGWFFKRYQKRAGGAVPSANRIMLLPDADGDGVAETRFVL